MRKLPEQKIVELEQQVKLFEKQKTTLEKQAKSENEKVIYF